MSNIEGIHIMDDAIIKPLKGKNDPDLPDRVIFKRNNSCLKCC